ncbi:MAG: rod shape-determining protein MreD [Proteobacteria bacterium]|jgi:rod shape-determining protein MreD|nr:rod shape-determining protein MreD [Pseudomonadota bacterium]MBK8960181.1 rod shape-determining protein MreD [Pseudomonadota bacterium]
MDKPHRIWVIALSFLAAFMLTAMPLPDWALPWRPAWIAMVLVYWCMALPERVGVITGWVIGLILDVMHGSILGQHAFGLAFVAYMVLQYHQRLRVFRLLQQALVIASIVFVYLLTMLWVYNLLGSVKYSFSYLFGAVTTGVLWPWVYIVLRDVRRRARVA